MCISIGSLYFFLFSLEDIGPGHWAELGVHWWGQRCCVFPADLPWQLRGMCQAKKKKRLEEMLVGAEPPIIVHVSVGKKSDIYYHPVFFFDSFVLRVPFPPYFFGLWRLKVFVNQKKAVDVLSKWPPKDRGTSRNPRSLDVDFSSSQVLRQQRLSRLLHPRWKEPGRPEAFWANSDGYTETWGRKM